MSSRKPRSRNTNSGDQRKLRDRTRRAQLVVCPTLDQWNTTSLIKSDFNSKLVKKLQPYSSIGVEMVRSRLQYNIPVVYQNATTPIYGTLAFQLNFAAQYSDYTATFDQYKIEAVSVNIVPQFTTVPTSTMIYLPKLFTAFDYDDNAMPTSISYVQAYGSCIDAPPGAGVIRTLRPAVAKQVYQGVTNAYTTEQEQWIDAAFPAVQHYGLKYAIEQGLSGQTLLQGYTFEVVLYVAFRSTR